MVVLTASCGPSYISGKLVTPRLTLSCQLGVSTASARAACLRSSAERSSEQHARARARQSVWRRARGLHAAKCMCSRGPRFHSNAASICMSRYMTAMANLILPGLAPAEIGPRPCYRSPPKTRIESLGTFRSHLELSTLWGSSIAKTCLNASSTPHESTSAIRRSKGNDERVGEKTSCHYGLARDVGTSR